MLARNRSPRRWRSIPRELHVQRRRSYAFGREGVGLIRMRRVAEVENFGHKGAAEAVTSAAQDCHARA